MVDRSKLTELLAQKKALRQLAEKKELDLARALSRVDQLKQERAQMVAKADALIQEQKTLVSWLDQSQSDGQLNAEGFAQWRLYANQMMSLLQRKQADVEKSEAQIDQAIQEAKQQEVTQLALGKVEKNTQDQFQKLLADYEGDQATEIFLQQVGFRKQRGCSDESN